MSTPVYIQAGYAVRKGYPVPPGVDVDAAGEELDRLMAGREGLDLEALREQARSGRSALRPILTMDPDRMADKLHLIELRDFVGALHVRQVDPTTEEEYLGPRAFEPTETPNVWRKIRLTYTPVEPVEPTPIVLTLRPPEAGPDAPPPSRPPVEPPPGPVVLTERQYRMREQLQRMAETLADDPYFARVVTAIRAL